MNTPWNADARLELERLLDAHHARLVGTGVDADEVVADLRRHVETELARPDAGPVDAARVRLVLEPLLRTDLPAAAGTAAPESRAAPAVGKAARRLRWKPLLWFFWVLLPVVTVGFEQWTGACAEDFADPLRTWFHYVAILGAAAILGTVLARIERAPTASLGRYAGAVSFAAGVGLYFTALIFPASFMGIVAIVFFGLGLIPASPLFLAVSAGWGAWRLRRAARKAGVASRIWPGLALGFLLMFAVDARWVVTGVGLHLAALPDEENRERGLAILRSRWASEAALLRACTRPSILGGFDRALNVALGAPPSPWEARGLYFSATGRDYFTELNTGDRTGRARSGRRFTDRSLGVSWAFGADDLVLASSRFDGLASPDALVGYVEWTAVVQNNRRWDREGRATLLLPPGGVVSRVTLWINDEEREAAFGGRAQTTRAYEAVTARRRDPLLVTCSGPERVDLRFSPVPRNGTMKFRIGISFPLAPSDDAARAQTALPRIVDSNVFVAEKFAHEVWYEAHAEPVDVPAGLVQERSPRGEIAVRGAVSDAQLGSVQLTFRRNPKVAVVTAPLGADGAEVVLQELRPAAVQARPRTLVIDGSPLFLRRHAGRIAMALRESETDGPVQLVVALEQPLSRDFPRAADAANYLAEAARRGEFTAADGTKRAVPRRAGFDNSRALTDAVRRLAGTDGTLWWCHGTQPAPANFEPVLQVFARRDARLRIVESAEDADLVANWNGLEERVPLHAVALSQPALRAAFRRAEIWEIVRTSVEKARAPSDAPTALRHVARLWAADEALRRVRADPAARDEAIRFAVAHQVVTPISGAVVLETAKQYDEHGLKPADPKTVPVVPEPQTYALMFAAIAGLILWRRWRQRSRRAA